MQSVCFTCFTHTAFSRWKHVIPTWAQEAFLNKYFMLSFQHPRCLRNKAIAHSACSWYNGKKSSSRRQEVKNDCGQSEKDLSQFWDFLFFSAMQTPPDWESLMSVDFREIHNQLFSFADIKETDCCLYTSALTLPLLPCIKCFLFSK